MKAVKIPITDIDSYIAAQPEAVRPVLQQLRQTIKKAAPKAEETISYQMPAFKQDGMLVYFAAWKTHIGFYAAPTGHAAFKKELAKYASGKGSVQFPLDEPLPLKLIAAIVKFRVKENIEKALAKKQKSKKEK